MGEQSKMVKICIEHQEEIEEGTLTADGFEDAIIGYGRQFNYPVAVYDAEKFINILQLRDGMTEEEAVEYFQFNVQGAYVGESTPIFIYSYV